MHVYYHDGENEGCDSVDGESRLEEACGLLYKLLDPRNHLFVSQLTCGANFWFHGETERIWLEIYQDLWLTNAFIVPEVAERVFRRACALQTLSDPIAAFADLIDWNDPYPL